MGLTNPKDAAFDTYYKPLAPVGAQTAATNRPTTYGLFGQSVTGPDGSIQQGFSGEFGQLNDSLTGQAAANASQPFSFGQFGVSDGSAAGAQAAQAAFGQAKSRLDPMWQKSEHDMQRNAFQSGMGSGAAMDNSNAQFGRARNDAYSSAMSDALRQGMSAQQSAFGGNLAARQMSSENAVRQQMQPWEELGQMQGFLAQPEYNRDNGAMVAAAAENAAAPARAVADSEAGVTQGFEQRGAFDDNGYLGAGGEGRKKWFNTLNDEQRKSLYYGFGNWGSL